MLRLALAGGAGGIVRALSMRLSPREMATAVVVGGLSSIYVAPQASPLFERMGIVAEGDAGGLMFIGFVIGLGGIGVAGFFIDAWKILRASQKKGGGK